ncbi:MAG: AraC family transcriptional regulator, partial [Pleurocapsa sp.]
MEILTKAEFDYQRLESTKFNQTYYNLQGFSQVARNIHKWSDYSSKCIKFASGIELTLCDEIVNCDHNVANEHNDFEMLVSKFYLSGHHSVVSSNIKNLAAEYTEKAGQNYLFYLPNVQEIEQFFTGTPLKKIVINLELSFLRSFASQL